MILTLGKKIVISVFFLIFSVFALAYTKPVDSSHEYKVIIIGAGSAGLGAAQYLYQHGVKDVLVIEARNRIGGRVWTINPWGTATDLGASWIMHANTNPLAKMTQTFGVNTVTTVYDSNNLVNKFSSFDLYDSNGKKISVPEMKSTLALMDKFNDEISHNKIHLEDNATMADAFTTFTKQENIQGKKLQIFNFIAKDMIESEAAADLNQISFSAVSSMHSNMTGKDLLPQGGYIRLFSEFVKNIEISLNNPVTEIDYDQQGVNIIAKKGAYHAQYAIVTLPLGVLKAGTVKFLPKLPKEKLASIKRLGMGFFNKVYLLFNKPFWNSDVEWISIMPNKEKPKEHYEILNLYKYFKQPILLFFSAGSFSEETENWTDKKIIDDVINKLKLIYGNDIPSPSAYLITRWGKDPYAQGSYSYPSIGSSMEDFKNLAAPIENKLFFAGEATSATDPSTVHGAFLSGTTAAKLVMQQLRAPL